MVKKRHEELLKALGKIAPEDWDKALEMLAIEKLATGDTYFGEQFDADDTILMQQNIKSDFPIFHETKAGKAIERGRRVGELEAEIKVLRDKVDEALAVNMAFQTASGEFRERMAKILVELQTVPPETDLYIYMKTVTGEALGEFSKTEIIAAKAEAGIPLGEEERKLLRAALQSLE